VHNRGDSHLFSLLKRKKSVSGLTGISFHDDGLGIARITRAAEAAPHLALCEFLPASAADRAGQLAALADKYQLDAANCTSLMDAAHSSLLLVEAPEVDPTELKAAVRWRIKDLIDFHVDDAVIDVFDVEGQRGRTKMMYVVVARVATVQQHIDLLEKAHVNLGVIDIAELAQRNIAALLPEDQSGVALLHLTPRGGLLTLTRQGSLFLARNLEFGTDQLAAELPVAAPAREEGEFTLDTGDDGPPPGLRRLMDSIVLEVQRSVDYFESHFGLPPISGLVIAPLARPIPGLAGYLGGNLGLPVRTLDLNTLLDCAQTLSDELQAHCLPAIGAALRVEERTL
jgi:MSHA biogenesis protein MshI